MQEILGRYEEWKKEVGAIKVRNDIRRFFDDIDSEYLVKFMDHMTFIENSMYQTPKEELEKAVKRYMNETMNNQDGSWMERIFAGVLAFIHTIEWGEPYPMAQYELEEKKWWQWWK